MKKKGSEGEQSEGYKSYLEKQLIVNTGGITKYFCFFLSLKWNEIKLSKPSEPHWGRGRPVLIVRGQRTLIII